MKEEWLFPNTFVPVDVETTSALIVEIKRLIDVVGGMALAQPVQEPDNGDELTIAYMSGVHRGKELAAQPAQEPDYAYPTIEGYEEITGFKVSDTFRMGWAMARTTNDLFKQMEKNA